MKRLFSKLIFLALILSSCGSTKQTSTLIGDSYDEATNKTTLILVPYGNVDIPGKWTRTNYNQVSRQQFFVNYDSATIAIAKSPKEKYPFFEETKEDFRLVFDFYKWDSEYWVQQGLTETKIKENKTDNYIIWQITGEKVNNLFLFGLKNNLIINYMVSSDWTESKKIDFLTDLYMNN